MSVSEPKTVLHTYLRSARDVMIWKLEGLGEYDLRRPLVPSGTNLLGLVKHLGALEYGYFGLAFGRELPEQPWWDDEDPLADLWVPADEDTETILGFARRAREFADGVIDELPLDAPGSVPWWDPGETTLQHLLVHMIAETNRHAGHADIVRELIDGEIGLRSTGSNLPDGDDHSWVNHHDAVEQAARAHSAG